MANGATRRESTVGNQGYNNGGEASPRYYFDMTASPELNGLASATTDISILENDYDMEPPPLYTALQKKQWSDALTILDEMPEEARTWVYRKEPNNDNKLRWRLLPIHGAIIFQAPPEVVESLLLLYPEGAAERDDEGSLPIHLAYKRCASASVCKLLLDAFPGSVDVTDRKGRTPKNMASSSPGTKHREFVYALKNFLLALRAARVTARSEERAKYGKQLDQFQKEHQESIAVLQKEHEEALGAMAAKNEELQQEQSKMLEELNALTEHVGVVEQELSNRDNRENELKAQMEALEEDLVTGAREKEESQALLQGEVDSLSQKLVSMQETINQLFLEKDVLNESLDQVVATSEIEKKAIEETIAEREQELQTATAGMEMSRKEAARLRKELEEQKSKEKDLLKKIHSLEQRVHFQSTTRSEDGKEFSTNTGREESLRCLEPEKASQGRRGDALDVESEVAALRKTVALQNQKLELVWGCLDDMAKEQEAIIEQADDHEAQVTSAAKEHARILEALDRQQIRDNMARDTKEMIDQLLQTHEDMFITKTEDRKHIVSSISRHTKKAVQDSNKRKMLVLSVKQLQEKINLAKREISLALPEQSREATEDHRAFDDESREDAKEKNSDSLLLTPGGLEKAPIGKHEAVKRLSEAERSTSTSIFSAFG